METKSLRYTVALALVLSLTGCKDEESRYHLGVLRQIAAATENYPDFKQVSERESSKPGRAMFTLRYTSNADYEDVKRFYSQQLLKGGWELYPKERRTGILYYQDDNALVLRKGIYQIGILRAHLDPPTRDVSITYIWESS